jgi:hypothetical protein
MIFFHSPSTYYKYLPDLPTLIEKDKLAIEERLRCGYRNHEKGTGRGNNHPNLLYNKTHIPQKYLVTQLLHIAMSYTNTN